MSTGDGATMGLHRSTIRKPLREDFPGTRPLVVDRAGRAKLGAEIKARLERFEGVDTNDYISVSETEKPRLVASFTLKEPDHYYSYSNSSYLLVLDDADRLTIRQVHGNVAPDLVGDLDEIVRFVRHYQELQQRQRALRIRRGEVRELQAQAILAQVRKLAREERFAFMSEAAEHKQKLFVKLSEQHAVELHVPFKEFARVLPRLRSVIASLRQLYQDGIPFQIVSKRALPWRNTWIMAEGTEADGAQSGSSDGHSP
jgi:hypothetical protein